MERLAALDHQATSEELRLRVVAQTNGENAALAQRALLRLHSLERKRRDEDAARREAAEK